MIHQFHSLSSSPLSPGSTVRSVFFATLSLILLGLAPPFLWGVNDRAPQLGLVINEIMKDPVSVSDTHGEYVEIFNPTGVDIDLNGWAIMDLGSDYHLIDSADPLIVGSLSYLVLARDTSLAGNGGFQADYQYASFTLSNGSDEVILIDPTGAVVDSITYDSVEFPSVPGCAIELRNPWFNNIKGYNWESAVVAYGMGDLGTPGYQNSMWEDYKNITLDTGVDSLVVMIGDTAVIDFYLSAQSADPESAALIAELWMPDGTPFPNNPLFGPYFFTFGIEERKSKALRIVIDARVESGVYRMVGSLLNDVGNEIDSEEVTVQVLTGGGAVDSRRHGAKNEPQVR